ncbi:MAG: 23S rRNA (cytidine1920-2'-O)/16S rRNA (cytidine1409-2'-O)-methyltransferase, partial [Lentisphaeria bacterium]
MITRLDQLLLQLNLASSRTQSQKMISAGQVQVRSAGEWLVVTKPSAKYSETTDVKVSPGDEQRFVSRAGLKLEGALLALAPDVLQSLRGKVALDIGQSTGGFTDCLLRFGIRKVVGIDVGKDQLNHSLRDDPRVVCLEGINARDLPVDSLLNHVE